VDRYSNALQAFNSVGVAGHDNDGAFQNLLGHHIYPVLKILHPIKHLSLLMSQQSCPVCIHSLKVASPGASKLQIQHVLDAVAGSIAPAAREYFGSLICFINHLEGLPPVWFLGC